MVEISRAETAFALSYQRFCLDLDLHPRHSPTAGANGFIGDEVAAKAASGEQLPSVILPHYVTAAGVGLLTIWWLWELVADDSATDRSAVVALVLLFGMVALFVQMREQITDIFQVLATGDSALGIRNEACRA
jgi:hypothetical protein